MIERIRTKKVVAEVKWYNPCKGYGFLESEEFSGDILIHSNSLSSAGISRLTPGEKIVVCAFDTPRGGQVQSIEDCFGDDLSEVDLRGILPAKIKWYSEAKGFGFARVFGIEEDIFIYRKLLDSLKFPPPIANEAVAIKVVREDGGPVASFIASWERVKTDRSL